MDFAVKPERRIAAASVAVCCGGCFLLIERKYAPYKGWLSFLGGKVELNETAIRAAMRELYEETALIAERLEFLTVIDLHKEGEAQTPILLGIYHALSVSGRARAGDDASALLWCTASQMQKMKVIPGVLQVTKTFFAGNECCSAQFSNQ